MKYRPELDGLRSIAVLSVILFHGGISAFQGGFVGVDIFFVISGYLISHSLASTNEVDGIKILKLFYAKRARRILPALYLMLIISTLISWFVLTPYELKEYSQSLVATSLFLANILYAIKVGYFAVTSELNPLIHTWSLGVEEQFYLVFPLLYLCRKKIDNYFFKLLVVMSAISLMYGFYLFYVKNSNFSFYSIGSRGWEILIGVIASLENDTGKNYKKDNIFSLLGFSMIIISVLLFNERIAFASAWSVIPILGTYLVICYATKGTLVNKILSIKILVSIGLFIFSLYLWHQPIYVFARIILNNFNTISQVILLIIIFTISYISYKYVELPFKNKNYIGIKSFAYVFCTITFFLVLFGIIGYANSGYPERLTAEARKYADGIFDKNSNQKNCLSSPEHFLTPINSCVLGDSQNIRWALLGDSHAEMYSFAISEIASDANVGVMQMTYGGCPPVDKIYFSNQQMRTGCFKFNEEVRNYIKSNNLGVIISASWINYLSNSNKSSINIVGINKNIQNFNALIIENYVAQIKSYLRLGRKVILIYPTPIAGIDVPNYIARKIMLSENIDVNAINISYSKFYKESLDIVTAFDNIESKNLIRIYPSRVLCNTKKNEGCISVSNGKPLYYDSVHLSNSGANIVLKNNNELKLDEY